jgi:hypothetical protein
MTRASALGLVGGGLLPRLITPYWQAGRPGRWLLGSVLLLLAFGVGSLSAVSSRITLGACCVLTLVAWVWARPAVAAYLLIGLTPLIVGIDRGLAIPIFRPNEALALVVGGALAARGVARLRTRGCPPLRIDRVELSMILLAVTSSVVPLLWMAVRQREITHDDLLYSLVMWKYLALYIIVRLSVTTVEQVRRCLWFSVAAACVVAVIAIFQALSLFNVPGLLATYYAPFGNAGALAQARGSSTLALPAATGDLLIYNLAITAGLLMWRRRCRGVLAGAAVLLVFGVLSAGEFSTAIGLLVGVICIAAVTGAPRLLFYFVLLTGVGSKAVEPVINRRLSGFESASGLPDSWTGRLRNLRTYFWPKLFSDWNILFGVRPTARVPVATQITGYVWIESGYTWLLWGGGIPLLGSFLLFVHAAAKRGWQAARRSQDATSVAGVAAYVAVIVTTVLMAFDPHLTYRGAADALFFLLALAVPREGATVVPAPAMTRPDLTMHARRMGEGVPG